MSHLVECRGCGGLKRLEGESCPHCGRKIPRWRRRLAKAVAIVAPGLVACGGIFHPIMVEYGVVLIPDSGVDAGDSGSQYTAVDAYGAVCLPGSTEPFCPHPDGGDGGDGGGGAGD